jgi:dUTP pyrophosphatase
MFTKLHPEAQPPEYKSHRAAGGDLKSVEDIEIPTGQWRAIGLGFGISMPPNYEAQIRPRSGLALQHGVTVLNTPGTIDPDYRGEVKVLLINHGPKPFYVSKGDRVAQMVISPVVEKRQVCFVEKKALDETARGAGGFGSTGRN